MSRKTGAYSFAWLSKKHGLTEAEVADMDVRYKHADLDRSGQLDREELKSLLKATIASKMIDSQLDTYVKSQWHNVDKDNSGSVDFDEFLALYSILKLESRRGTKRPAAGSSAGAAEAHSATGASVAASGVSAGAAAAAAATGVAGASGAAGASAAKGKGKGKGKAEGKADASKESKKGPRTKKQKTFKPTGEITQPNYTSSDIVWAAIRTNNSFMLKRNGVVFSRESGNIRNIHGQRSSGLSNKNNVHISGRRRGKIVLRLRAGAKNKQRSPAKGYFTELLNQPNRVLARKLQKKLRAYGATRATRAALSRMSRVKETFGVKKKTKATKAKKVEQAK